MLTQLARGLLAVMACLAWVSGCGKESSQERMQNFSCGAFADGKGEPVAIYSRTSFGPEGHFRLEVELAVVNIGDRPLRLEGPPGFMVETIYYSYFAFRYYIPSEEKDPRAYDERLRLPSEANFGQGPTARLRVGSLDLAPGQTAVFHYYDLGERLGRTPDVVKLTVSVDWVARDGQKHTADRSFNLAAPPFGAIGKP